MDNQDFKTTRYSALIDTWSHHNTMQLQWPSMAITTVLIVLSILASNQLDRFLDVANWGRNRIVIFGGGVPLLLLGLGTCAMLYLMGRAKRVMNQIEKQITQIEKEYSINEGTFSSLNHPKGISGVRLVRTYLTFLVSFPVSILGFLMTFGCNSGSIASLLFIIISIYIERSQKLRALKKSIFKHRP